MSKLTPQDDEQNKLFKPKIYQSKRRWQMRNFYDRHGRNYPNRYRSDSTDRRISFSGRIQCGQVKQIGKGMSRAIGMTFWKGNYRGNLRPKQM